MLLGQDIKATNHSEYFRGSNGMSQIERVKWCDDIGFNELSWSQDKADDKNVCGRGG